jgi:hypothetical protein
MATFTVSWTTGTNLHTSAALADAGTVGDDINLASLGYYAVQCQLTLDADTGTPSGDVTVNVYGSADGGTADDTEPLQSYVVNFTAQALKRFSFVVENMPHIRVEVTNNVGESITYSAIYAGLKQSSA